MILFVSGIAIQGMLHRLVLEEVIGDASVLAWLLLIEAVATLDMVPVWLWL